MTTIKSPAYADLPKTLTFDNLRETFLVAERIADTPLSDLATRRAANPQIHADIATALEEASAVAAHVLQVLTAAERRLLDASRGLTQEQ
jgi:hypothetical protein